MDAREREVAFTQLYESLCSLCVLVIPCNNDSYILHTDTSGQGTGAVLSVCRSGQEKLVSFFSHQLRDRETLYAELYCVICWSA